MATPRGCPHPVSTVGSAPSPSPRCDAVAWVVTTGPGRSGRAARTFDRCRARKRSRALPRRQHRTSQHVGVQTDTHPARPRLDPRRRRQSVDFRQPPKMAVSAGNAKSDGSAHRINTTTSSRSLRASRLPVRRGPFRRR